MNGRHSGAHRRTITDDIDGSEAQATVRFGLDGVHYEIDLSFRNAEALREAIEPFVTAARVVRRGRPAHRALRE